MVLMRGAAIVIVLGAWLGCEEGVVIEVRPPKDVPTSHVELFIGDRSCDGCDGLLPPGGDRHIGEVYLRTKQVGEPFIRPVIDGSAVFRFPLSDDRMEVVLAIGTADIASNNRGATGGAIMRRVDLSSTFHYVVDLAAADREALVGTWDPTSEPKCAGVKYANKTEPVFVVPADDPDCDAVPDDLECDDYGYKVTNGSADPTAPTCVAKAENSACTLGGMGCDEKSTTNRDCVASNYCVPDTFCSTCGTSFSPQCLIETQTAPLLTCKLKYALEQAGPVPCAGTSVLTVDTSAVFTRDCVAPPMFRPALLGPVAPAITFGDPSMINHLSLKPTSLRQACSFDFVVEGRPDMAIPSSSFRSGFAELSFGDRTVALPFEVHVEIGECDLPSACIVAPTTFDSVFACGR